MQFISKAVTSVRTFFVNVYTKVKNFFVGLYRKIRGIPAPPVTTPKTVAPAPTASQGGGK